MLLTREKKLLELLYTKNRDFTVAELAGAMHISPRTVKTDIKRISGELTEERSGCVLHTKTGKGIWLTYDSHGKDYLDELLRNGEEASYLIPENRKYFVALKLLDAEGYISMESIANSMFVSKGTIVNCMIELEPLFKKQGIVVEKKVKYGMRLIGEEGQLRIAKASIIRKNVSVQGNQIADRLQPFFEGIPLAAINTIIQDAENKFEFLLADTAYSELVIQLAIMAKRIQKGRSCSIGEAELRAYQNKKEWNIVRYLSERLEAEYSITLSPGDMAYLMMNLEGMNTRSSSPAAEENIPEADIGEAWDLQSWEEILMEAGIVFHENLPRDEMLKCALYMHLKAMFNRLRHRIHLSNPMKHMVKEELVYEVEVASFIARRIKEKFGMELGEDEICDIAIYLGASLEREKAQKSRNNPNIVVVCGSGLGTSQFIEAKLKRIFPHINITKVLSVKDAENEVRPGYQDLVISTVPLSLEGIEVLFVSPILAESDITAIEKKLYGNIMAAQAADKGKYESLFSLMDDRISIFKCDLKTREEVIRLLGSRLLHEKYVEEGFVESAFKREELSATSIGDSIAVPHAFEGHVRKIGIGLLTLKKPIQWGNEKVQIILMLALDARAQEQFKRVFTDLAELTKDTSCLAKILNAEKLSDMIVK